jgi:hypothetical protein
MKAVQQGARQGFRLGARASKLPWRVLISSLDFRRIPRSEVLAIPPKNNSITFSQGPWVGVKMNSKRLGTVAGQARVSREIWAG